ncbi:MAG: ATP-binding protein [Acidimicrobiales bacterium]
MPGNSTQFVGRAAELADLRSILDAARGGRGGAALVVGEAGIGKTALVQAVVDSSGMAVLWARAHDGHEAPAMWLWRQVARAAAANGRADAADALDRVTDHGAGIPHSGNERFLLFDAVSSALQSYARAEPLLVVLDDLQWADRDSLAMLEFLAADARQAPLAVVATARSGEVPPLRVDLRLELQGLAADELAVLLTTLVGVQADHPLLDAVLARTAGNPFFVGEMARLLRASGDPADPEQWRGLVPEGVRAVLLRRLARLPQESYDALLVAAVLGPEPDADLLAVCAGLDRPELLDRLDPAVRAGLLRGLADGRFGFAHALVRDAALAGCPAGWREQLHRRAAAALERDHGELAAAEIASHLLAVGDREQAAPWAEQAGVAAYARSLYAAAAQWFEVAVDTIAVPSAASRVRLAESLSRCGRLDEAHGHFALAYRQAAQDEHVLLMARAALGFGTVGGCFEIRLLDAEQEAALTGALRALEAGGAGADTVERSLLLARLSVASTLQASASERLALAEEAMAIAHRLGDDTALAVSLAAWCDANAGPDHVRQRRETARAMLAAASRTGDPELVLLARRYLIVAAMEQGDVVDARIEVAAFARLADTVRQPHFCWYARLAEGMLALFAGDLTGAGELADQASRLGRLAGSANARMLADGALVPMIARELGDAAWKRQVLEVNADHPEAARAMDIVWLYAVGYGATRAEIEPRLARVREFCRQMPREDSLYLLIMERGGAAAALAGDEELMTMAETALSPFAELFVLDGTASVCYEPVSAVLGRMAAARGEIELARRHYDGALALLGRCGPAPLLQQRIESALAELPAAWSPSAPPAHSSPPERGEFRRVGDVWAIGFNGEHQTFRHAKGLGDLALLLARPAMEVHVLDLVVAAEGHDRAQSGTGRNTMGPALDAKARAVYEQRIRDLTEEIEVAEANNDLARAGRHDDERAALLTELAAALGLGGRDRPRNDNVERARKAVGMRIGEAIARIERDAPALGRHLRNSVRTGVYCCYQPERPVTWRT